ncbi:MAG: hypothetical protein HQL91_00120 [Magnetococcales bacterium]|nr:hypothetical protein [Magnetococcales bacterium]
MRLLHPGWQALLVGALLLLTGVNGFAEGKIYVVAHRETPAMDAVMLQKVFLGKVIRVNDIPVVPVNLLPGNQTRQSFLAQVLEQSDEKYVSYWTVRRYIGQGSPPREFGSGAEMLDYLRATPGAVGYVEDVTNLAGLVVVLERP